ncbi:hypothetical protein Pla175_39720 [Pirellulimonas nuda]|uniref:Uncharacterized protein n=1 Tax=Pirellulimonas nuda TaxID=2528009 RepID=A0A518DGG5_9BACT|nr:hypothetical protein [Pirellulimonas nuda]QDU90565.1 hypothetical protein Pla175_39720 [Pirellulimonas nuda]
MMNNGPTIEVTEADDGVARLVLTFDPPQSASGGVCRGPLCDGSRTLPAEFPIVPSSDGRAAVAIIDPCYSTDAARFYYELTLGSGAAVRIELRPKRNKTP